MLGLHERTIERSLVSVTLNRSDVRSEYSLELACVKSSASTVDLERTLDDPAVSLRDGIETDCEEFVLGAAATSPVVIESAHSAISANNAFYR